MFFGGIRQRDIVVFLRQTTNSIYVLKFKGVQVMPLPNRSMEVWD